MSNQYPLTEAMLNNKYFYRLKSGGIIEGTENFLYYNASTKENALDILSKGFDSNEIVHFYDNLNGLIGNEKIFIIICRLSKEANILELENSEENYKNFAERGTKSHSFTEDGCKILTKDNPDVYEYAIKNLQLLEIVGIASDCLKDLKELSWKSSNFEKREIDEDKCETVLSSHIEAIIVQIISQAVENPLIFWNWKIQNLSNFINKVAKYKGNHACPFSLPVPLEISSFEKAFMEHLRQNVSGFSFFPGTYFMSCSTREQAVELLTFIVCEGNNPWWNDVNSIGEESAFPMANLFTLRTYKIEREEDEEEEEYDEEEDDDEDYDVEFFNVYPPNLNHPWV
jgi:hypothetical protein